LQQLPTLTPIKVWIELRWLAEQILKKQVKGEHNGIYVYNDVNETVMRKL